MLYHPIDAILYYERLYKRIPPVAEPTTDRLQTFKRCAERYNIPQESVLTVKDVVTILEEHKKSPMEFQRKDRFVICSDNYRRVQTLTIEKIKELVQSTKQFLEKINKILTARSEAQ